VYRKSGFLYALDTARRAADPQGEMIVVEGYFDTMMMHQAGLRHTVATSGTALTQEQARMLHRIVPRVALTYDGDAAGQEAMMRSLGVLLAQGLDVVVVELPKDTDPDTLLRSDGVAAWDAARAGAYDPVMFVHRHLLKAPGTGDPRERALQAVVRLGGEIQDPIRLRLLLERGAEVFGLAESVLSRAVALRRQGQRVETPVRAAVLEQRRGEANLERRMLAALLHAPEALEDARQKLSPEDFRDPDCRALALWLWSGAAGLPIEEPLAGLARELAAGGPEGLDWNAEAVGGARQMTARRLRQELQERRNELSRTAGGPETERLMQEIDAIARSLRELSA
jgi:DNA primase